MSASVPPAVQDEKRLARRWGLAIIVAAYLALAGGYAVVTPFGQPPDETAHALYVQHLVRERTLPVLRRSRREAYEFHQPPLYYLLASPAWAAGSLVSPAAARTGARVVSILIGAVGLWLIALLAGAIGPRDGSSGDALALGAAGFAALLPMRLATAASVSNDTLAEAVFTAGLLLMIRMVRDGPTVRRAALLGLILGLAILTKSSDLLLFPVALVALLLACQAPEESGTESAAPEARMQRPASSDAGRLRVPAKRMYGAFLATAAATFGVALLIGGGWMARSAVLYGDPLGTRAFEQYFQDTPTPAIWGPLLGYNLLDVLWRKDLPLTFDSFWGVFGHMEFFMGAYPRGTDAPGWTYLLADHGYPPPSWLYPLLLIPTVVAVAGLGLRAFGRLPFGGRDRADRTDGPDRAKRPHDSRAKARAREGSEHPNTGPSGRAGPPLRGDVSRTLEAQVLLLVLAWFLVAAAFLRFNLTFFQAQGRYLFPAMGPIALGFAAGWLGWWPARRQGLAVLLLMGGMLALALYALFGTLLPAPFGGR